MMHCGEHMRVVRTCFVRVIIIARDQILFEACAGILTPRYPSSSKLHLKKQEKAGHNLYPTQWPSLHYGDRRPMLSREPHTVQTSKTKATIWFCVQWLRRSIGMQSARHTLTARETKKVATQALHQGMKTDEIRPHGIMAMHKNRPCRDSHAPTSHAVNPMLPQILKKFPFDHFVDTSLAPTRNSWELDWTKQKRLWTVESILLKIVWSYARRAR